MKITRKTPFRSIGRVPFETWQATILKAGGREQLASRGAWDAAGDLSAVLLALLFQESKYDTVYQSNSKARNNPFNIRVPDYSNEGKPEGYVKFDSLVAACAACRGRINGEAGYFDGVNPYAAAATIEDLLTTYAPPKYNPTERLITEMVDNLNAYLPDWAGPVEAIDPVVGELNFGNGVEPASTYRPLNKGEGQGGNYTGPAKQHIGIVSHETQLDVAGDGVQELEFWFDFFNCPGGERCASAACHHIVSTNGLAYTLIDPRSTFEPWVNGGLPARMDHPIGGLWNRTFGSANRNKILRGIENNKKKGGSLSPGQIAWNAQMLAAILNANKVPWTECPRYRGVQQSLQHNWIAPTDCMIPDGDQAKVIAQAQAWMKKWQLDGAVTVPSTPAEPIDPAKPIEIFPGLDVELAQRWFGKQVVDGRTYQLTWPLGPVASLWIEHGKQTGNFAPLLPPEVYKDGRTYFRFEDGFTVLAATNQPVRVLKVA